MRFRTSVIGTIVSFKQLTENSFVTSYGIFYSIQYTMSEDCNDE